LTGESDENIILLKGGRYWKQDGAKGEYSDQELKTEGMVMTENGQQGRK
jgi:hypothetical protein